MKSRFSQEQLAAMSAEAKEDKEKKTVARTKPLPRKRGRPKKDAQAPRGVVEEKKRGRGRPRGGRKPLVLSQARKARRNSRVPATELSDPSAVFAADEETLEDRSSTLTAEYAL